MAFNIVLVEPEIPNNTGNIGRLALASGSKLHLVKPFGFELNDSRVKRAGLDYWAHLDLHIYESMDEFFAQNQNGSFAFLSSHGKRSYTEIPFQKDLFLVFGKESVGLPKELLDQHSGQAYKIPLFSPHIRSINLANAVGVVAYEGIRALGIKE